MFRLKLDEENDSFNIKHNSMQQHGGITLFAVNIILLLHKQIMHETIVLEIIGYLSKIDGDDGRMYLLYGF